MEKKEIKFPTPSKMDDLVLEFKKLSHIKHVALPEKDELMYENRPIREQVEKAFLNAPLSEQTKLWLENSVVKYIESPIILDDFEDDGPRDKFEKTLEGKKEIYDFYKSNRLRRTNISNVIRFFKELKLFEEKFKFSPDLAKTLDEIYFMVSIKFEAYEKMEIKDKLEVTRKVAKLAREICVDIIQKFSQVSL
ncbi:hypothetical protein A3I25_01050 [Candidatus Nomurabacteria bacterium RIFCSPLOWO2_02_FULL_42_17]|uniref:Uncharacterized protein n=2 Tax=Candidatus Nomuraibacteriota TaxID=1752729 RepID=A0A1F6WK06_9BACT|nr:MAG: hypothetical protein UV08_C0030G0006 [Parcubacteria group bacterium GW2011_GWA2_42_18]OGI82210.1 MAG: hypothetical protein A3B93_00145 [Candidatus Nomurabacteria bacterium RIFCSPHIGHO2_02_FULL_42_24]OGI97473.1 MAG: hypothetical protein A3I25_01050 [Candidatus Nomurabacteria bacterium RIFCSPLOWO2_02_FULL_42_17]